MFHDFIVMMGMVAIVILVVRHFKTYRSHNGVHSAIERIWHWCVVGGIAWTLTVIFVFYMVGFVRAWQYHM